MCRYFTKNIQQIAGLNPVGFKEKSDRLLGIKVAFDAIKLTKIQHYGESVFTIPIPESLLWVEARDFYRVKLPTSKPNYCQLILKDQKPINLQLYDISLIGFSMLTNSKEVSDSMSLGALFEECKLILMDTGEDTISFKIQSRYIMNPENLNRMEKISCKFTLITPAFENTIQRHMLQIERESRQINE